MKRTMMLSLLLISVAGLLVGLGTFAYFSDTASSTGNTFSTGNVDLQVSNGAAGPWSDDTSATWTMANMKPGDTLTANLYTKNNGSIEITNLLSNLDLTNDPQGLSSQIFLTAYNDNTSVGSDFIPYFLTKFDTNGDGKLSLAEMSAASGLASSLTPPTGPTSPGVAGTGYDTGWYCNGGTETSHCMSPGQTGYAGGDGFFIHMVWQFNPAAGNGYQNATTTFSITLKALTQGFVASL